MAPRGRYKTRQRELVAACLQSHDERYLTVDEAWAALAAQGESVGRSTVYRALEALVAEGRAVKATAPGGEARYRQTPQTATGQLMCLGCGCAYPLDCHMVDEFTAHVREHHGFCVMTDRTVLYGLCRACQEAEA